VTSVEPGGAAAATNIAPGVLIVEIGTKKVATVNELAAELDGASSGGKKSVLLLLKLADGSLQFISMQLADANMERAGAAQPDPARATLLGSLKEMGLQLQDPTSQLPGVPVSQIIPGSQAQEKRINVKDRIVEVMQVEVRSVDDVLRALAVARQKGLKSILLKMAIGQTDELRFVALRLP
jgi:serine protease Do